MENINDDIADISDLPYDEMCTNLGMQFWTPFPMETLPNFLLSCKSSCSPNTERQLPAPEMNQPAPETCEGVSTINTAKNKKKKKMNIKMIISQNVCDLKRHEKKDEFFHHLQQQLPFAALLQETY